MSKEISAESLYSLFPPALKADSGFAAIGEILAEELAKSREMCNALTIYAAIDRLSEEILDVLAGDFNVEWYDYDGTLEEKRSTIRECISIHRYKGTKYAVETALQSVYASAKVQEWFDYGGEPYHFKVTINDSTNDTEKRSRILAKVKYYKNLRSVLEETVFQIGISTDLTVKTGISAGHIYKRLGATVKNYGVKYKAVRSSDLTINYHIAPESFYKKIGTDVANNGVIYNATRLSDCPLNVGFKAGSIYKKIYTEVINYGME